MIKIRMFESTCQDPRNLQMGVAALNAFTLPTIDGSFGDLGQAG